MPGVLKTVSYDGRGRAFYRIGFWDENISCDEVILLASQGDLPAGTVLGKITASGKYAKYNPALANGQELPAGAVILQAFTPNLAADQKVSIDVRNGAVNGNGLSWPETTSAPQKTAVYTAMAARALMVRF